MVNIALKEKAKAILNQRAADGQFEKMSVKLDKEGGSFHLQLVHYAAMHNVVKKARPDSGLQENDIITEINRTTLIDQKIDTYLEEAEGSVLLTIFRPKAEGALLQLLLRSVLETATTAAHVRVSSVTCSGRNSSCVHSDRAASPCQKSSQIDGFDLVQRWHEAATELTEMRQIETICKPPTLQGLAGSAPAAPGEDAHPLGCPLSETATERGEESELSKSMNASSRKLSTESIYSNPTSEALSAAPSPSFRKGGGRGGLGFPSVSFRPSRRKGEAGQPGPLSKTLSSFQSFSRSRN